MTRLKCIGLALGLLCLSGPVAAQPQPGFSLAMRGVPLDEALAYFVEATGAALAYDPALVAGKRTYCVTHDTPVEAVLRCLLDGTGLDYHRRSSGTFVLTRPVALPPTYGFLSGAVVDADTDAPLADAHVFLSDRGVGTVTNAAGQFVFPALLPGQYRLQITHVSYRPWQDTLAVAAGGRVSARAALEAAPILITPVIVDGDHSVRPAARLRFDAVSPDRMPTGFEAGATTSALAPLQSLAGIRFADVSADVYLQGGDPGAHQFRLDGAPVYLPRFRLGYVGPFSPFALDRIAVHKAGFGAEAGSHLAGVLQATHAVETADHFDLQADPTSLNGRFHLGFGPAPAPRLAVMGAARIGPWAAGQPRPLETTLRRWSAPDAFLLLAPLRRYADATPGFFADVLRLDPNPNPAIHFSDLHAAARLRLRPLHTLYASFYRGTNRLTGDLVLDPVERQNLGSSVDNGAFLNIEDGYRWTNGVAQVRYDAVLSGRTLLSAQVRGSHYRFTNDYRFLERLLLGIDDGATARAALQSTEAEDGNRLSEAALDVRLDHARGRHHLELGTELTRIDSRFDLRLARLVPNGETGEFADGVEVILDEAANPFAADDLDATLAFTLRHGRVHNTAGAWRWAAFAEDRVRLGAHTHATAGLRLTLRPERGTVYAEPRLAVEHDWAGAVPGAWRLAAGLYRQFMGQYDVSTLNAGALLPSTRIWLPLDATTRPPVAYHLAGSMTVLPSPVWEGRLEAYFKHQPHGLALDYGLAPSLLEGGVVVDQSDFLARTKARFFGGAVTLAHHGRRVRTQAQYQYSHARFQSDALFGGRAQPTPESVPHRLDLALDVRLHEGLSLSARWQGMWGRTWAFRRAYYDYFGHDPRARFHLGYDLGSPGAHRLPAHAQLDLGAAYTKALGPTALQFRLDVLNLFDRQNAADQRLVFANGRLVPVARPLYGRIPSVAVRVRW